MTTKVTAMGTRRAFCEVQRNAVSGPSPLGREREPLVGRQTSDRGARQNHETDGLLPRAELPETSHRARVPVEPLSVASSLACAVHFLAGSRCVERATWNMQRRYSHSIVAGGFELTSYTTRFTPRTSLIIRLLIRPKTSGANANQSAVIPSRLVTARNATT